MKWGEKQSKYKKEQASVNGNVESSGKIKRQKGRENVGKNVIVDVN